MHADARAIRRRKAHAVAAADACGEGAATAAGAGAASLRRAAVARELLRVVIRVLAIRGHRVVIGLRLGQTTAALDVLYAARAGEGCGADGTKVTKEVGIARCLVLVALVVATIVSITSGNEADAEVTLRR